MRTVTVKLCETESPYVSVAFAVTVAVPEMDFEVMVRVFPDTLAVTVAVLDDEAENEMVSPSGSANLSDSPMVRSSLFLLSVCGGIIRVVSGGLLTTSTSNPCWAKSPSLSVAFNATLAVPRLPGTTRTRLPTTLTVATDLLDEVAE